MPRAGIFASAHVPQGGGGGGVEFLTSDGTDATASSNIYTFPDQPLGTPSEDRLIVVCFGTRANGPLDTVTVAGIAATIVADSSNPTHSTLGQSAIAVAAVPTGSTGDVKFTFGSGSVNRGMFSLYAVTGLSLLDAIGGAASGGSIDTASGGALITVSQVYYSGGEAECTWSPSGLNPEDADRIADGIINFSSAHVATSSGSASVAAAWSPLTDGDFLAAVTFEPA